MNKEISFALYAIKKNFLSSTELRTSFLMNVFGMALNNTAFIILWTFFVQSVGVIGGWTATDIIGLLGFSALSYGVIFTVTAGIRNLPDYVATGAFDRFMLSPKNILIRVATSSFNASGVGDFVFGIVCLSVYSILIHVTPYQLLMLPFLIVISATIFLALAITIYSTSFYFIDSESVTSGLFELFMTPSLFHGGAFQGGMRFVFTFIIPSLVVGTLPVEAIRNASLYQFAVIAALAALWLAASLKIFNVALRKYESANFMTFGS